MTRPHGASTAPPVPIETAIRVVVMGVAGCGKSVVGRQLALALCLPLVEGDDYHCPANVSKMQQGRALTDADRADWLQTLGRALAERPQGAVLTCSALKLAYRNILRSAADPLYFVHLAITQAQSLRRVGERAAHFYPASLVASQFDALQDPSAEPGVLTLDGNALPEQLAATAAAWLRHQQAADTRPLCWPALIAGQSAL